MARTRSSRSSSASSPVFQHRLQAIQRPKAQAAQACPGQLCYGEPAWSLVPPLNQQPLGRSATSHSCCSGIRELRDGSTESLGCFRSTVLPRDNPVDPAQVQAAFEIAFFNLPFKIRHHEDDVLNDTVIHICDVEGAVGPNPAVHRTKAFIRRGKEFLFRRIKPGGLQLDVAGQLEAANEMPAGFRNEDVAVGVVGELISIVETGAGDDRVSSKPAVGPQLQRAERDLRRDPNGKDLLRIAGDVTLTPNCPDASARLYALRKLRLRWRYSAGIKSA